MKNIFKFLGIAVLACGMMVSCGKDNPEEGTDTTPVTPPAPQRSFTVTYGSTNLDITSFQAIDKTAEGYLTVYGYENGEQNSRFVQGFLESTVVANATYESTGGDVMNYRDPSVTYYDADGVLSRDGSVGTYYGHYTIPATFIENVTAIDLNALTMSANWTAKVILLADYVANQGNMDACAQTDFSGNINNMTWVWKQQ